MTGGRLKEKILSMPDIYNFVTTDQLDALEKRLLIVFATIEYCKNLRQYENNVKKYFSTNKNIL